MTLNVKAVFDYTARNEKELSFNQGDMLHVIEKTPDNNWWDGMFEGKRGFIPVAYVEIVHPSGSMTSLTAPVPAPPARLSSLAPVELPEDPMHEKTADKVEDTEMNAENRVQKKAVTEHTEETAADTASPKELAVDEVMPGAVTELPTVTIPEEQMEMHGVSSDEQQENRTPTTPSSSQDNLTAGSLSLPRNLSPVTEDASVKPRLRAGSSTTAALKSRIAAFEHPQQGLSASTGTSGHQRSISVDDPMGSRRMSDSHGIKKLSSSFDPSNASAQQQPQHKPVVMMEKGPKVKEMAQQQGLPFTPMVPGQFPAASPLQRSVLLRQTDTPPPPPDDPKKKAGKPPILARPARLSAKRDVPPPPKPKGDQLSAELRAKLGQSKSQPQ